MYTNVHIITQLVEEKTQTATSSRTPAYAVVVEVLAALGAEHFDHHAVEMKPLHQHPGKRTQEEEVKQHRHHLTGQLEDREGGSTVNTQLYTPRASKRELCRQFISSL